MCAYKRDAPNNTYKNNDIPRIGRVLQLEYSSFPLRRIEMAEFLEEDCSAYLGQELNLRLTANMRL